MYGKTWLYKLEIDLINFMTTSTLFNGWYGLSDISRKRKLIQRKSLIKDSEDTGNGQLE